MCGRYTLSDPGDLLEELGVPTESVATEDGTEDENLLRPRYNIAPTQNAPVVRDGSSGREVAALRWGLVPGWAKELAIGNRMINARGETLAEKPSFRVAYKRRRCLILSDGFYEWKKVGGQKQPYHIHRPGRAPFVMAGLWERWSKGPAEPVETFTIVTIHANDTVSPLHHRMPVILEGQARDLWLDPSIQDPAVLQTVVVPDAGELVLTPVSRRVNRPANDDPTCLEPVEFLVDPVG